MRIILLVLFVTVLISCEKNKIAYDNATAAMPEILPVECEACHNGTFPEHISNAHAKHAYGANEYTCTTCHYGHGWETITHMNAERNVDFDPNGLATRYGLDSITPVWDPETKTCSNVYCHSNGVSADRGSDGTYTWGTAPFGTANYFTTPNWENGKITECTYCHNGLGNMTAPYLIEQPNTLQQANYPASGAHQNIFHMSNTTFSSPAYTTPQWGSVQCFWCHTTEANNRARVNGPLHQGTYGTSYHADGETYFKPLPVFEGGTMAAGINTQHCTTAGCW